MSIRWLALVITLPTENSTARMRIWRALKSLGCGALRDGVYVMPWLGATEQALHGQADDVIRAGGSAHVIEIKETDPRQTGSLRALFDRGADYAAVANELRALKTGIRSADPAALARASARLRRQFEDLAATDFFPGAAREQVETMLRETERAVLAITSPGEPRAVPGDIRRLEKPDYRRRVWATRKHPWIDRLASAWLIKRFIDPEAKFAWIEKPRQCPKRAIGFDFDGAPFTHVGGRVTFEVLLASFGLEDDRALTRLGMAVHYLDAGGVPVKDADGIAAVLEGARQRAGSDDKLLGEACRIFDFLYASYSEGSAS